MRVLHSLDLQFYYCHDGSDDGKQRNTESVCVHLHACKCMLFRVCIVYACVVQAMHTHDGDANAYVCKMQAACVC